MRPYPGLGIVRRPLVVLALVVASCLAMGVRAAEPDAAKPKSAARRAVEPAAPILPATVVANLQEGKFAAAEAELKTLANAAKTDDEKSYLALILGTAQRLGGKADPARETLSAALAAAPKSFWAAKLRYELAGLELASGRVKEAEALTRAEAEILLAGDRKDRLAEVYHAFARRLLKPDDPITPPDPRGALDLLAQARGLAKGEPLRARLLFAIASAAQAANDHARAIQEFQSYLKEYPTGADRLEVRYQLGVSQQTSNQHLAARLTWSDLARDLDDPAKHAEKGADAIRAMALYKIATTYHMPGPPDDTSLNLGVAAIRRFLSAYPAHPIAVNAAFEIATAYAGAWQDRGGGPRRVYFRFLKEEPFKPESDDAKPRLRRTSSMTATFEIRPHPSGLSISSTRRSPRGRAISRSSRTAPCRATTPSARSWIPSSPSPTTTTPINATTEAARAWQLFATQNPLDARVPQALFLIGSSFESQKKYDGAITAWEPLLSRFPGSEPAAHAQFMIAAIYEEHKGDLESAIERFKKVAVEPWKSQSGLRRVAVMESKTPSWSCHAQDVPARARPHTWRSPRETSKSSPSAPTS